MAGGIEAVFAGAGLVILLLALLPYILLLVALWRIGTGLQSVALETRVSGQVIAEAISRPVVQAQPGKRAFAPPPGAVPFQPVPEQAAPASERPDTADIVKQVVTILAIVAVVTVVGILLLNSV